MSSVLFVEPLRFFSNPKGECNLFCRPRKDVSATQESLDTGKVCTLIEELSEKLSTRGVASRRVRLHMERKSNFYIYEAKGEAILAGHTMSIHNFTNESGAIERRVLVLYPVSPFRQQEIALRQVENVLAEDESEVEIVDLRGFQGSEQYLEGTASLVFSADGRFVYMARSSRSSEAVLDVLCNEENLNIPPENRFIFDAVMPTKDGEKTVPFTNMLGWCGTGICSWCLDLIKFQDPEEQERFYSHLEKEYDVVVELSPAEVMAFAGCAFEVTCSKGERTLFMSMAAKSALSMNNAKALKKWYGSKIIDVYSEALERRCGTSAPSMMVLSQTMGPVSPCMGQKNTLDVLRIPAVIKA